MAKKNKKRTDVVYSTNPNFQFSEEEEYADETLPVSQQDLRVMLDKKQRNGKEVTLVTGFIGTEEDLKDLGKAVKQKCGVGGSVKDGEIIIQGNQVTKVMEYLQKENYKVKKAGG